MLEAAKRLGIRIPTMCHVPGHRAGLVLLRLRRADRGPAHALARLRHARGGGHGGRTRPATTCARPARWRWNSCSPTTPANASRRAPRSVPPGSTSPASCTASRPAIPAAPMEVISERLALPGSLGPHLPPALRTAVPALRTRPGAGHRRACIATRPTWIARRPPRPFLPPRAPAERKIGRHRRRRPRRARPPPTTCCRRATPALCSTPTQQPGGMLRYGIPAYRLPKQALDAEIDIVRAARRRVPHGPALGQRLHPRRTAAKYTTPCSWRSARNARKGCAARARRLALRGHRVSGAGGQPATRRRSGSDVVVVGGGNTAMDCARSAVRLGARACGSSTAAPGRRCPA